MTTSPSRRRLLGASILPAALSLVGCGPLGGGPVEEPVTADGPASSGPSASPKSCLSADGAAQRTRPAPPERSDIGPENEATPDGRLSQHGLALLAGGARIAANQTSDALMLGESDTFGTVVWNIADGSIIESYDNGLIGAIVAHPDGRLAMGGAVTVEIRDGDGELVRAMTGGDEPFGPIVGDLVSDLAFTADGSRLVVLGADGRVTVWHLDADTCEIEHELASDLVPVIALSISPADDSLALCGESGQVEIWDPIAGTPIAGPQSSGVEGIPGTAAGLAHADDGTLILCTDDEPAVHALSPAGEPTTGPALRGSGPYWAAASSGGRVATVARGDNRVVVWDRESGEASELPVVRGSVGRLVWSPDGGTLFGASPSQGVISWSGSGDWTAFDTP